MHVEKPRVGRVLPQKYQLRKRKIINPSIPDVLEQNSFVRQRRPQGHLCAFSSVNRSKLLLIYILATNPSPAQFGTYGQ